MCAESSDRIRPKGQGNRLCEVVAWSHTTFADFVIESQRRERSEIQESKEIMSWPKSLVAKGRCFNLKYMRATRAGSLPRANNFFTPSRTTRLALSDRLQIKGQTRKGSALSLSYYGTLERHIYARVYRGHLCRMRTTKRGDRQHLFFFSLSPSHNSAFVTPCDLHFHPCRLRQQPRGANHGGKRG